MKKSIAFGTAVSLFAMSAVVGSAATAELTSLGLKGSLENIKAGDEITVDVYCENDGETFASFAIKFEGVTLDTATIPTGFTNSAPNGSEIYTIVNLNGNFGEGTIVCSFTFVVDDPSAVSITLSSADNDVTVVGSNNTLKTSASGGSGDSDSDSGDSNSSTDDSNSSTDDSDSSTDDSDSSTDDSNSSTDDSNSSTDDSDSSTDDSNSSTDDSNSSTDDSNSSADDSNSSTDDSNTSGSGTSSNSGSSTGTGSGSKDPGNVDTGIGFVLAPAILAGAALIISKKRK